MLDCLAAPAGRPWGSMPQAGPSDSVFGPFEEAALSKAEHLRPVHRQLRWRPGSWLPAPVTGAVIVLLWLAGTLSASLWGGPRGTLHPHVVVSADSLPGHWWAMFTSGFWARDLRGYILWTVLLLIGGTFAERRLGHWRFAAAALGSPALGIVAALSVAHGVRGVMGSWSAQLLSHSFVGPSAMLCGAVMAATSTLETLWRRRIRLALSVLLILLALYSGSFPDLVRLGAAVAGALLGPLLLGRVPRIAVPKVSRREARVLVAVVVAASAIGPVLAGLLPQAVGPLAVLRFLFTNIQPVDPQVLQTLCSVPDQAKDCAIERLQLRAGSGGLFMAVLPCVLLLLFADGLRRGRRFAWYAVLALQGGLGVLAGSYIAAALSPAGPGGQPNEGLGAINVAAFHHPLSLVLPLLLPLALVVLLLVTRRLFAVTAPRATYSRLFGQLLATAAVLGAVYVVAGLALKGGFTPVPGPLELLADVPDRFLPLGFLVDVPPAILPQTTPAVLLYEGVGVVFWAVAGVLVLRTFLRPAHNGHGTDEDRARAILRSSQSSSLSWMTTWAGNNYWFSPNGKSFVAYRVISGIALALGPPVGPHSELGEAVEDFTRYAGANGWTPIFYSVGTQVRDLTTARGWGSVQVAQETVLDLGSLTFTGKKFQDIRTALNKAAKQGIRAQWVRYPSAPLSLVLQIHAISEDWVANKGMPEMGFTLGGLDELNDPEVRCLLAIDEQNTVHAIASWLPVYRDGAVVGWTLDFMRRRSDGFRPGIDFVIASAALSLKEQGYEFISLSGAPLARTPQELDGGAEGAPAQNTGILDRLLDRVGAALEPVYGFRSLLAFKNKFQPRTEPLYLVYPDAAALPSIGNAIARAYLPKVSFGQGLSLVRKLVRGPRPRPGTPAP